MWPLLSVFVEIALHRRGPDSLPSSRFFVLTLLTLYLVFDMSVLLAIGLASAPRLGFTLLNALLYLAFAFAVLRFFRRDRRFMQTMGALIGTDILFSVISLPVTLVIGDAGLTGESPLVWVYLAIFFWWIDVASFILSRAIEQPYIVGLMFVILYVMTSFSLSSALIPAPVTS